MAVAPVGNPGDFQPPPGVGAGLAVGGFWPSTAPQPPSKSPTPETLPPSLQPVQARPERPRLTVQQY
ncbi:MAG: hypothetical protein K0U78_21205 [Actinomycetia bacterium]|nr:hypothetical protein [Actinomycetes bacterium]